MLEHLGCWVAANAAVAIAAVSAMIAAISAIFAVQTYRRNANTKRAEFLLQLHKAFFVDPTYKSMRTSLMTAAKRHPPACTKAFRANPPTSPTS